jgi:hypothetical protein
MESIFLDRKKAHDKLHEHPPTHIAVAYVGRDWNKLIDCSQLEEIIVSPTLGTNPRAVDELVEKFGWEHVHFLDELHAKIYLSQSCCIWGSFNLSRNALGQENLQYQLYEAGCLSFDQSVVLSAFVLFDELLDHATQQYPTIEKKKKKLGKLRQSFNLAIENNLTLEKTKSEEPQIPRYNDSYFISFSHGSAETDDNLIKKTLRKNKVPENYKSLNFAEQDKLILQKGKWILTYAVDENGNVFDEFDKEYCYWIYIHDIIDHAYKNTPELPCVVFQWDKEYRKSPLEPFEITPKIYKALKKTLQTPQFKNFNGFNNEPPWTISKGNHNIEEFVNVWRENFAKLSN